MMLSIMLGQRNHTQKATYYINTFRFWKGKLIGIEIHSVVVRS